MTNFKFKKKYGQNFLNDQNVIDKIVNSINPDENDLIVEIGPGAGALTKKLKKYNCNLIAFEIDEDTKQFLLPLEDNKTKIIYEDFLTSDVKHQIDIIPHNKLYILGNLPYYITTPIIEKIIDLKLYPESITIMVQKEVADRFLAKPGVKEYGYMTVLLNLYFAIEKVCDVPRKLFYPIPNVDSTVLILKKDNKEIKNYDHFKNLLKNAFQFKRKTINNNLKSYNKETLELILKKHGYDLSTRSEAIDLETFIDMANNL